MIEVDNADEAINNESGTDSEFSFMEENSDFESSDGEPQNTNI